MIFVSFVSYYQKMRINTFENVREHSTTYFQMLQDHGFDVQGSLHGIRVCTTYGLLKNQKYVSGDEIQTNVVRKHVMDIEKQKHEDEIIRRSSTSKS